MDTAIKAGIDAAKTASKRVFSIGDLIGNKTAEEITSADKTKTKGKEKKDETNEIQELFIHPEKCQKILML